MKKMGGLWSEMPLTGILWFSASLILAALPPTSGFVGKWILFVGAFKGFHDTPVGLIVVIFAVLSTLLTLVYTFMAGIRIFFGSRKPLISHHPPTDPPFTMSLPLLGLVCMALSMGLYPRLFLTLLGSVIGSF